MTTPRRIARPESGWPGIHLPHHVPCPDYLHGGDLHDLVPVAVGFEPGMWLLWCPTMDAYYEYREVQTSEPQKKEDPQ